MGCIHMINGLERSSRFVEQLYGFAVNIHQQDDLIVPVEHGVVVTGGMSAMALRGIVEQIAKIGSGTSG